MYQMNVVYHPAFLGRGSSRSICIKYMIAFGIADFLFNSFFMFRRLKNMAIIMNIESDKSIYDEFR